LNHAVAYNGHVDVKAKLLNNGDDVAFFFFFFFFFLVANSCQSVAVLVTWRQTFS